MHETKICINTKSVTNFCKHMTDEQEPTCWSHTLSHTLHACIQTCTYLVTHQCIHCHPHHIPVHSLSHTLSHTCAYPVTYLCIPNTGRLRINSLHHGHQMDMVSHFEFIHGFHLKNARFIHGISSINALKIPDL